MVTPSKDVPFALAKLNPVKAAHVVVVVDSTAAEVETSVVVVTTKNELTSCKLRGRSAPFFMLKIFAILFGLLTLPIGELSAQVIPVKKIVLPPALNEISGLSFVNDTLYAINDGGNPAEILAIDTNNGQVARRIHIRHSGNIDWEDMASDGQYLYIGDIGNNQGTRTDLRILRIPIASMTQDTVEADTIGFAYSDQNQFNPAPFQTPFDAECIMVERDSITLITKRWNDGNGTIYRIPRTPGNHLVDPGPTLPLQGLCGGGTFRSGEIFLIGYPFSSNHSLVWKYDRQTSTSLVREPVILDHFQAEAICEAPGGRFWVAHESGNGIPATLYVLLDLQFLNILEPSHFEGIRVEGRTLVHDDPSMHELWVIENSGKVIYHEERLWVGSYTIPGRESVWVVIQKNGALYRYWVP